MKGPGCTEWLASVLNDLKIPHSNLSVGEVVLPPDIKQDSITIFKDKLQEKGCSIIFDRKSILTEKVKHVIYEMLTTDTLPIENYSKYISGKLFLNYTYLANVFSETEGITIEHFIINNKIEKVKQYLQNTDHSVSHIADIMHYSSVGHLSNQFKKVTGQSPSEYKKTQQQATL